MMQCLPQTPLKHNPLAKIDVVFTITQCFALCKTYGKTAQDMDLMIEAYLQMLGDYSADLIIKAFKTEVQECDEIPTLARITSRIKRNGKPPLRESDIIAIRKKDGADRSRDDWQMLREWEAQQSEGWEDATTAQLQASQSQELTALRRKVAQLEAQLLGNRTEEATSSQANICIASIKAKLEKPLEEKIQSTVDMMRRQGCTEEDVLEFIASISP
jgi:hypothetical protein